ncbi:S8 family serine peptidase [Zhengella mangrovi]|uniref:S8 family serine peptidase n=1 Tax=Zhengella mangrovi TaxID=1982044 RepID=UPI0013FD7B39|nr:S8 family serine peptidase [Zhengella mangrovi]
MNLIAVAGITLATMGGGTVPSLAQQSVSLPLAAPTLDKIVDANSLAKMMADNPAGRYRVIIQYENSDLGAPDAAGSKDDDAQYIARNHALQDLVLSDVFGSSDGVLNGPLSDVYGTERMNYSQMLVMNLTAEEIDRIAASGRVTHIQPDVASPPVMDESTVHINMPAVWAAGGTGTGRTVAIMDTGVKKAHEFITPGRVVAEACFNTTVPAQSATTRCPGGLEESTASGSAADCASTTAFGCSHGTHVTGTAAGNNTNRQSGEPLHGMAYQANIIGINVFSLFSSTSSCGSASRTPCVLAFTSDMIAALEHVYSLRSTYNIDAVNMSIGGGAFSSACDNDSRQPIITNLRNAGIASTISAGNDGLDNQVGAPGCISSAITVASSLDTSDSRSSFSNWGSLIDVVAPGSNILSSVYGPSVSSTSTYENYNGTSMAAPHVAGAFAALRSLFPTKTVTEIENALESTGVPITSAGTTKPRIDMLAACNALGAGTCAGGSSGPTNDNFANAIVASLPYAVTGHTNVGATSETGEPALSAPNNSVWYKVTIPSSTTLHVDTNGSALDTFIGLFSGSSVSSLTTLATNDDGGTNLASLIEMAVNAGTYYIAVDGFSGNTGTFNLNISTTGGSSGGAVVASVLPTARATQTGTAVTAFATIINPNATAATGCSIALPSAIAGTTFLYQTTNASNVPIGTANTPVNIAAGGSQGFYFALSPTAAASSNIPLVFDCTNTSPAGTIFGVNTFQYTASTTPIADLVAIAATVGNTGYISIPGTTGQSAASVAAINIGASQTVTASVTEQAIGGTDPNMPATLTICRANSSGVCQTTFAASTSFTATAGQTYYFVVLAQGSGTVADNPATNRAHIYFRNASSQVVGATSVAVRTQ